MYIFFKRTSPTHSTAAIIHNREREPLADYAHSQSDSRNNDTRYVISIRSTQFKGLFAC